MTRTRAAVGARRAALTALIATNALWSPACSGSAFTSTPEAGSGGGNNGNRGGSANPTGGGHSGGLAARTGGAPNTQGGSNPQAGSSGDGGVGAEAGSDEGGSSSGGRNSGGAGTTGGKGSGGAASGGTLSSGGTRTGGSPGTGGKGSGGAISGGAPTTGGKAGTGGTASGGASGGTLGSGGTGGTASGGLGVGGLTIGGALGTGGGPSTSFPATPVLDNFNSGNAMLGTSWVGATDSFAIKEQHLVDSAGKGQPLFWGTAFGANQEVFATLTSFHGTTSEINLILKAQQVNNPCELIEVMYHPDRNEVGVDLCSGGDWTSLPVFAVTLLAGDQFGARITAAGKIAVYRNGTLLTTFNAAAFPQQTGGYIGVNSAGSSENPAMWDNFGGGTVAP